ncbi:substrate-binding periplasmic protein [Paucibacter soli]|uniref:substrate-binding periplasmic protein n=1 Tax=Paucibacter soli TaxID=3133433 RepID=UPI0030B5D53B
MQHPVPHHAASRSARPALLLAAALWPCLLALPMRAAYAAELRQTTVHICDDGAEWPPYTYYKRVNGRPSAELVGYSVDVITAIFKKAGIAYTLQLLPWLRCQKEVAAGQRYQLALNASHSAERERDYFLSLPYYRTTNYYFYSRSAHPQGLHIEQLADLKRYRVCGLHGYNYATYGLASAEIDSGARNFSAVITKLQRGDCELFLEKYEVLAGFAALGQDMLSDPALGRQPVPGMQPTEFHMLVSRQHEHGAELLRLINEGLRELQASQQLRSMLAKYMTQP